jgi:hypothetical protein
MLFLSVYWDRGRPWRCSHPPQVRRFYSVVSCSVNRPQIRLVASSIRAMRWQAGARSSSKRNGEAPRDPSSGLLVYQEGGVIESRAFDFYGAPGYIIRAVITVNLPKFAIAGFGLELPWKSYVRWLEDPREIDGRSVVYRFGGKEFPEFDRSEVLNHHADVRRIWSRGASLKGHLLGIGNEPIPEQYPHGAIIPAFLIIYDQFSRPYPTSVSLWTDRTAKPVRGVRRTSGLLDRPEPVAGR